MGNVITYLEWRYAVKKFNEEKSLPPGQLQKLKKAFNLTATSYGLQPIKMAVLQNKEIQKQLVPHSFGQWQVAQASHLLVLCIQKKIDNVYITRYFDRVKELRGTDDKILAPFINALKSDFSIKKEEEIRQWAINQAYLAMGNLLTVCAVEQIDACPMEGFVASEYDRILRLDAVGLTSVLVMPIGYRAEDDFFAQLKKVRRTLEDSIIEI